MKNTVWLNPCRFQREWRLSILTEYQVAALPIKGWGHVASGTKLAKAVPLKAFSPEKLAEFVKSMGTIATTTYLLMKQRQVHSYKEVLCVMVTCVYFTKAHVFLILMNEQTRFNFSDILDNYIEMAILFCWACWNKSDRHKIWSTSESTACRVMCGNAVIREACMLCSQMSYDAVLSLSKAAGTSSLPYFKISHELWCFMKDSRSKMIKVYLARVNFFVPSLGKHNCTIVTTLLMSSGRLKYNTSITRTNLFLQQLMFMLPR